MVLIITSTHGDLVPDTSEGEQDTAKVLCIELEARIFQTKRVGCTCFPLENLWALPSRMLHLCTPDMVRRQTGTVFLVVETIV